MVMAVAVPERASRERSVPIFPPDKMKQVAFWLRVFMEDWHGEAPLRIHHRDTAKDGSPDWHPDFARWIELEEFEGRQRAKNPARVRDQRIRTTRAFRKLRKRAPREFDVLYCLVVHRMTLLDVSQALTERAVRLNKPERYTPSGVLVLTVSAVDKMMGWW